MLVLVLVVAFCMSTVTIANAEAYLQGTLKKVVLSDDQTSIVSKTTITSTVQYTKDYFVYDHNSNNENAVVFYVAVSASELATQRLPTTGSQFIAFAAANGGVQTYPANEMDFVARLKEIEAEADYEGCWFVFVEADSTLSSTAQEETYSKPVSICFDTKAPEFDSVAYVSSLSWVYGTGEGDYEIENVGSYVTEATAIHTLAEVQVAQGELEQGETLDYQAGDFNAEKVTLTLRAFSPSTNYSADSADAELIDDDFTFAQIGWWIIRVSVKDSAGNVAVFGTDEVEYFEYRIYVIDTKGPTITVSKNYQETGLRAGSGFIAPTPSLTDEQASSTSYTYKVYKWIGGTSEEDIDANWSLMFDSVEGVQEGYEEEVINSSIYTNREDAGKGLKVVETDEEGEETTNYYFYKIVYVGQDDYGNLAVDKDNEEQQFAVLFIKLLQPASTSPIDTDPNFVWKIVLICIAVLAAAGLVYMIFFYKPKQLVEGKKHYAKEELPQVEEDK